MRDELTNWLHGDERENAARAREPLAPALRADLAKVLSDTALPEFVAGAARGASAAHERAARREARRRALREAEHGGGGGGGGGGRRAACSNRMLPAGREQRK